jgi:dTDP-4-amino-4,6-dideoxygalactose transaminase
MNELSAGLGIIQLKKLDRLNLIRNNVAKRYHNEIELEEKMPYQKDCSYHFYWIMVKNRDKLMQKLKQNGIETGIHYRPIHTMSMYKNKKKLPITEKVGKKIISLPTHPNLTNNDVTEIISKINRFL